MYDCIRPGQPWLDTDGNPIQAHGGSVMYIDGTYYWYGENKEKTTGLDEIWHWGVRLYSSRDLYNWQSEGIILMPRPDDPTHQLHPSFQMDRPHILFCDETQKIVMWVKFMSPGGQHMGIAVADSIKGPFEYVKTLYLFEMESGDFDLVKDESGKAYIYFEHCHTEMICAELTEDYTDVTGVFSRHFTNQLPPYTREAPAFFKRDGKMYLLTSGTTGYFPNPSEIAVSTEYHGPWTVLGDPCVNDVNRNSFHSQFSSVFKVQNLPEGKELFVALGDRWLTDIPDGYLEEVPKIYDALCCGEPREEDFGGVKRLRELSSENTSQAKYVWLPIVFEKGEPRIYFYDSWRIEDFM